MLTIEIAETIEVDDWEIDFGKMTCFWDEGPPLLFLRSFIGPLLAKSGNRSVILDEYEARGRAMLKEKAGELFALVQAELALHVIHSLFQEVVKSRLSGEQSADARLLKKQINDLQRKLRDSFPAMRNEALDIRPGRKPKVSVEEIIECLRKLPNNPTLTRLTAEMDVPMRTIQYALKAAGMTFAEAKKKAKAQQ